jgi:hypothetical protein
MPAEGENVRVIKAQHRVATLLAIGGVQHLLCPGAEADEYTLWQYSVTRRTSLSDEQFEKFDESCEHDDCRCSADAIGNPKEPFEPFAARPPFHRLLVSDGTQNIGVRDSPSAFLRDSSQGFRRKQQRPRGGGIRARPDPHRGARAFLVAR